MRAAIPTLGRYGVRLGGVALGLATLSGCQSIDINGSNQAGVRLVNASPNLPTGIDFYDNGAGLAYNLGFTTLTASYIPVSPGTQTIAADTARTTQVLVTQNATLGSGKNYTVLVGNVASGLQETVLQDQNSPAPTGDIAVRFLDQATHVGAIDIYLVPSGGKLTTTLPLLTNINFETNTGYVNIPAGTYAIAVVPTGTVPISTTTTLLTGPQVGYSAGAVRTVVLMDQQITSTPGVQAIVGDDYDSPTTTG
jgi:hypothetical protein